MREWGRGGGREVKLFTPPLSLSRVSVHPIQLDPGCSCRSSISSGDGGGGCGGGGGGGGCGGGGGSSG